MAKKKNDDTTIAPERTAPSAISIEQPKVNNVVLELISDSPLIQNAFSQKTIEQMLRKHMGFNVQKENKVPRQCIEDATIRNIKKEVCIPTVAFKNAMLTASMQIKGMMKTRLRPILYVVGQSIPVVYDKMTPRMDMVRTATGMPDVRFRPMFENWSVRVALQFADILPVQTVVDLLNRSGRVGVGEWRPEKNGVFGTYHVARVIDNAKEVAEVWDISATPLIPLVIPPWAMDQEISSDLLERIARDQALDNKDLPDEDPTPDVSNISAASILAELPKPSGNGKGSSETVA